MDFTRDEVQSYALRRWADLSIESVTDQAADVATLVGVLSKAVPEDLAWTGFVAHERNEYGVWRTVIDCQVCGQRFSLTPALTPESTPDPTCGAYECASYDINRDVCAILGFGWGELKQGGTPR